ncbi:hypothetical protein [Streptomyces sp. NPDC021622]|uniref:hypothetical protein n=1 Tax=Streptomyces sp. NPDC021622 TaxID=3155013 RepID=UPI00340F168B
MPLQVAGLWLPLAAVLLAVAGILLALRRRRAVILTSLGTALAGALLALAVTVIRGIALDDLPATASRAAAGAVYDTLTHALRVAAWVILGVGLATAVGAWLLRRRRSPAPPNPSK